MTEPKPDDDVALRGACSTTRGVGWWRVAAMFCVWLMAASAINAAELKDHFADREVLVATSGTITGSNTTATREPGEPQHADKPGGRSVWISWVAPTNGIATFRTSGSGFDTLLAAYYFKRTNDTTLDELEEAASNDDGDATTPASVIHFGVEAGVRYEIAVDGYRGSSGDVRLDWDFTEITTAAPVIANAPKDRALRLGDPLTLAVNLQPSPNVRLQWRFNGDSFGEEGPALFIPSLQVTNVGRYTLRIRIDVGNDEVRFETSPVEIQINSEGQTNALARDKILDAADSPLTPEDDDASPGAGLAPIRAASAGFLGAGIGVSRGYNGTQIFNSTYATPDPEEPQHCGVAGGASYWFAYEAPANGTLFLDTIGSRYNTVLAAYEVPPGEFSYANLVSLGCDNDAVAPLGASRVQVSVVAGKQYLVAVDGVGGVRGIAQLNYRLELASVQPPTNANTFRAATGSYHGLFLDTNAVSLDSAGLLKLTLRPSGAFSGSIRQAQRRLSFTGRFDHQGRVDVEVPRKATNALALSLNLDLIGGTVLTGRVSTVSWAVDCLARRAVFRTRTHPATNYAGRYTLLFPGAEEGSAAPMGDGFSAVTISTAGTLHAAGVLADGTAFSQSVPVSSDGDWPLFASLYRGRGVLAGNLRVRPRPDAGGDIDGTAHWLRRAGTGPATHTNGFLLASTVMASDYAQPGRARILDMDSATLTLIDASGAELATSTVAPGPGGRMTNHGPHRLRLSVSPRTGLMRGSIVPPDSTRALALRGAILQRQQFGGGHFQYSNAVGRVHLGP